jgi:spermidine synthase
VITSDPIHPWVKGAATLYTREYFELCRARLKPGGVISQWVPLYESSPAAVKSELATFFAAFPEGTVWSNDQSGRGYDVVLLAQAEPMAVDVDALLDRLSLADHYLVAESLDEVGIHSVLDLLATYAGSSADLAEYLADAEINYDRNLRLQYLAGLSSGQTSETAIHDDILRGSKYPQQLFKSSPEAEFELRDLLVRKKRKSTSRKG